MDPSLEPRYTLGLVWARSLPASKGASSFDMTLEIAAVNLSCSVSAHRLKANSSLTGLSLHCDATWSVIPQFTQNCTPEHSSATRSAYSSKVAFTASSRLGGPPAGLRTWSLSEHSRAKCRLCPQLKQAPAGALAVATIAGAGGALEGGAGAAVRLPASSYAVSRSDSALLMM